MTLDDFKKGNLCIVFNNADEAEKLFDWCQQEGLVWLSGEPMLSSNTGKEILAGGYSFPRYILTAGGGIIHGATRLTGTWPTEGYSFVQTVDFLKDNKLCSISEDDLFAIILRK